MTPILVLLAQGATGHALLNSYEAKIFNVLRGRNQSLQRDDPLGLSEHLIVQAIGKYRYYIKNGFYKLPQSRLDAINLATPIAKDLKITSNNGLASLKALMVMLYEDIKETDGDLWSYLRGGMTDVDLVIDRVHKVVDRATEETEKAYKKVVPWWARPGTLITVALLGGGVYLAFQGKKLYSAKKALTG